MSIVGGAVILVIVLFVIYNFITAGFLLGGIIVSIVFATRRKKRMQLNKKLGAKIVIPIVMLMLGVTMLVGEIGYFVYESHSDERSREALTQRIGKEVTAIHDGDFDAVKGYLEDGWDPNKSTQALNFASLFNKDEEGYESKFTILKLLLTYDANPNVQLEAKPRGCNTPLTQAAECRNYDAVKLLLQYGADPNYHENHRDRTALHCLGLFKNDMAAETLQLLLDHGANFEETDDDGVTAYTSLQEALVFYKARPENAPDYQKVKSILEEYSQRVK